MIQRRQCEDTGTSSRGSVKTLLRPLNCLLAGCCCCWCCWRWCVVCGGGLSGGVVCGCGGWVGGGSLGNGVLPFRSPEPPRGNSRDFFFAEGAVESGVGVACGSGVGPLGTAYSFQGPPSPRGGNSRHFFSATLSRPSGTSAAAGVPGAGVDTAALWISWVRAFLLSGSLLLGVLLGFLLSGSSHFGRRRHRLLLPRSPSPTPPLRQNRVRCRRVRAVSIVEPSGCARAASGCRWASTRRLCSVRHSPGQGINRHSTRSNAVRVEPPVFFAGAATCPCFRLPESRRSVSAPSQRTSLHLGRRRREALRRECAARAGPHRAPRVRAISVAAVESRVSVGGARKPRAFKGRLVWDAVAFDARLSMQDRSLADRELRTAAFLETLPALSPAPPLPSRLLFVSRVPECLPPEILPSRQSRRRTEKNFVKTHRAYGRVPFSAAALLRNLTREERFAARVAAQLPQTWRRACSPEDLAVRACYILDATGSRVRSRHFFGNAAGRVIFLSRAKKNQEAHADNGNTPKKAPARPDPKAKAAPKAAPAASSVAVGPKTYATRAATGRTPKKPPAEVVPKEPAAPTSVNLETLVVDPARCRARTWNAGAGRQCLKAPCVGQLFCAQHAKSTAKHGTVEGAIEPAVQALYDGASKKGLRTQGFAWYSRVKLWDEARHLGKAVADLTPQEFQRGPV